MYTPPSSLCSALTLSSDRIMDNLSIADAFGGQYGSARFFYIFPIALLAIFGPIRLLFRRVQESPYSYPRPHTKLKLVNAACFTCVQLALTIVLAKPDDMYDYYVVAMWMPSAASGAWIVDIYQERLPPVLLDTYLSLILVADVLRAVSYWTSEMFPMVTLLSVCAVNLSLVRIFWEALHEVVLWLQRFKSRLHARFQTIRYSERTLWDRCSMFMFFGFLEFRQQSSLPELDPDYTAQKLTDQFDNIWDKANKHVSHALMRASARALLWPLITTIPPKLCYTCCQIYYIVYMRQVMAYVAREEGSSNNNPWDFVRAIALVSIAITIAGTWRQYTTDQFDGLLHGLLSSITLKKSFRLHVADAKRYRERRLCVTEIDYITDNFWRFHTFWLAPFDLLLGLYFFYSYEGAIALFMFPPLIAAGIIGYKTARGTVNVLRTWRTCSDKRVTRTTQVVSNIRAIKILGLVETVRKYLQPFEEAEVTASKETNTYHLYNWVSFVLVTDLPPLVVIAAGIILTRSISKLEPVPIFNIVAFVTIFAEPSISLMKQGPFLKSIASTFDRIQGFLYVEELNDLRFVSKTVPLIAGRRHKPRRLSLPTPKPPRNSEKIIEFYQAWVSPGALRRCLLRDINVSINRSTTVVVAGPVASGKSTFLRAIVGEVAALIGSVWIRQGECITYCGQTPWLQDVSIRENIVQNYEYDDEWYQAVLNMCMLLWDLQQLPDGDACKVGAEGSRLSPGQQQRVALARALYPKPAVLVVDDIFSALDKNTASRVLSHLVERRGPLKKLPMTVVVATQAVQHMIYADQIVLFNELYRAQVATGRLEISAIIKKRIIPQQDHADKPAIDGAEAPHQLLVPSHSSTNGALPREAARGANGGKADMALYFYLLKSASPFIVALWVCSTSSHAIIERAATVFLREWLDYAPEQLSVFWLYFLTLCVRVSIIVFDSWFYHFYIIPQCATKMNQQILDTVLQAPYSLLGAMDDGLNYKRVLQGVVSTNQNWPMALKMLVYGVSIVGTDAVLITRSIPLVIFILPVLATGMYGIKEFFFQSSRQLRKISSETKTTIQEYMEEASTGLEHIRAMGWGDQYLARGFESLDNWQKIAYAQFKLRSWLILYINLNTAIMMTVATIGAVFMRDQLTASAVGLAFVLGQLTTYELTNFFQHIARYEDAAANTALVRAFIEETPKEQTVPPLEMPQDWPHNGAISLKRVSASYRSGDRVHTALHQVSLDIDRGQNVGIIGRSGSGKSTLLLSILNFLEYQGSITIDGTEVFEVSTEILRNRITSIPQRPVRLVGNLRDNIIPWEINNEQKITLDEEIIALLGQLSLAEHIELYGNLDSDMDDMNFSFGQYQLIAIARAILHQRTYQTRVVLMDEAMSGLHDEMEQQVYALVRQSFSECTVLMVSHRTDMIKEMDMIVEVVNGRLSIKNQEEL